MYSSLGTHMQIYTFELLARVDVANNHSHSLLSWTLAPKVLLDKQAPSPMVRACKDLLYAQGHKWAATMWIYDDTLAKKK